MTPRLRLEPIGPSNAEDFWLVHNDPDVSEWYDGWRPTPDEAVRRAETIAWEWHTLGVHKWMAYERTTGHLVGRGGLSRVPVDDDWGQICAFLPDEPWVHDAHDVREPVPVHAHWLEIGWALRREYWGQGYASEIGHAGLAFAFEELGMQAVVSCTELPNLRSRAVMERIGMDYAGDITSDGTPFAVCVMLRRQWPPVRPRG